MDKVDAKLSLPFIGKNLPDFTFEYFQDNNFHQAKLSDFKGKWLVLFFYPADFTFVCPTELQDLAQHYDKLQELGVEVVSFSTDTVYVHKAWHDSSSAISQIKFPMGADPAGKLARTLGIYLDDEGVALRATFIIDPDGQIRAMEVHDNSIGRSSSELVRKVQAAIYVYEHNGEVCPASWEPGKETLKPGVELVGKI